jgi:hypothetical protein
MSNHKFKKIADLIYSKSLVCSLYIKKNKKWLRIKIDHSNYLFYLITTKNLLDFLSGKLNVTGLFYNSPEDTYLIQHKNEILKPKSKICFNYKSITNWDKFYNDFNKSELLLLNKYLNSINLKHVN